MATSMLITEMTKTYTNEKQKSNDDKY